MRPQEFLGHKKNWANLIHLSGYLSDCRKIEQNNKGLENFIHYDRVKSSTKVNTKSNTKLNNSYDNERSEYEHER